MGHRQSLLALLLVSLIDREAAVPVQAVEPVVLVPVVLVPVSAQVLVERVEALVQASCC